MLENQRINEGGKVVSLFFVERQYITHCVKLVKELGAELKVTKLFFLAGETAWRMRLRTLSKEVVSKKELALGVE